MKTRFLLGAGIFFLVFALPAEARDVVVAFYNVENYLPMKRKVGEQLVADAPKPESEIRAVVAMLKRIRPDVLGLAEMGDEKMLAHFQARLSAEGLAFPHSEWVAGDGGDRHLALLSKYPIREHHSRSDVTLELNGHRYRLGRGILDVTLALAPACPLRLVGLHLKSRRAVPVYDEEKFRSCEAVAVRRYLDAIFQKEPAAKVLLFGDLNDTKNEFPIKQILGPQGSATSLRDLPLRDRYGLMWTHFWQAADVYSRLDFLMASTALWPEIQLRRSGIGSGSEWRVASDHRPIYTTISTQE